SAVKVVVPIVDRELVFLAGQREATAGNAIAVAANDGAEVRARRHILLEAIEPQHDVARTAGRIRRDEPRDDAPVGQDVDLDAGAVRERRQRDLAAVLEGAIVTLGDPGRVLRRTGISRRQRRGAQEKGCGYRKRAG